MNRWVLGAIGLQPLGSSRKLVLRLAGVKISDFDDDRGERTLGESWGVVRPGARIRSRIKTTVRLVRRACGDPDADVILWVEVFEAALDPNVTLDPNLIETLARQRAAITFQAQSIGDEVRDLRAELGRPGPLADQVEPGATFVVVSDGAGVKTWHVPLGDFERHEATGDPVGAGLPSGVLAAVSEGSPSDLLLVLVPPATYRDDVDGWGEGRPAGVGIDFALDANEVASLARARCALSCTVMSPRKDVEGF